MRKVRVFALLLAALCAAMGARANEEVTIDALFAANGLDALLARHAAYSMNTIYYDEAGKETFSTYQALGKTDGGYSAAYEDSDGYTEFLDGEIVYGFDPSANRFSETAFFEGQYDRYIASFDDYVFVYDPAAQVKSVSDDGTTVEVLIPRTDDNGGLMDSVPVSDVEGLKFLYTVDPDAFEIKGYTVSAVSKKGEELVAKAFLTYLDAPLTPPDYVGQLKNPTEKRTVTVVYPDSTQNQYVLPKDTLFSMSLPDGYGAYYDAEGELPITSEQPGGGDMTIYIRAE
jgi:hypothetical protein